MTDPDENWRDKQPMPLAHQATSTMSTLATPLRAEPSTDNTGMRIDGWSDVREADGSLLCQLPTAKAAAIVGNATALKEIADANPQNAIEWAAFAKWAHSKAALAAGE